MSGRAFTRARVERLLWRAGFGPARGEVARWTRAGVPALVDHLLRPRGAPFGGRAARIDGHPLSPEKHWGQDTLWWLDRVVRGRHQLVERMTFNWHDHFATSSGEVGARLMLAQHRTLRAGALGRFRDLVRAIARDGAMQLYLDLANSHREAPNENFARELMELFTLGAGAGYSERDVREAARALTGFTYDWERKIFGYDPDAHDDGRKTIFGHTGRFTPLDVIDLVIAHPAHAPFICRTLWGYFSPRPCPPALLARLVRTYRAADTDVRPVLRRILTDRRFFADLDAPDMVKPPFVYVAGLLRALGRPVDDDSWAWRLQEMGQMPFHPPNVSGWPSGQAWLSTGSLRTRFHAATAALGEAVADGSIAHTESAERALARARAATNDPWLSPRGRAALRRYAKHSVAGRTEPWEVKHFFPERQRVLRHLLLAGPDAQVC